MHSRKFETIKSPEIYGNWTMQSPDAVVMCRMSEKKAKWYVSRDLAELVGDKTIRLKFQPKGPGDENPYMLEHKHDLCVVCGADEGLTFHHVVPYAYRKFFPMKWKAHYSHDNLLVCHVCHLRYERLAWTLKKSLQAAYAPISPSEMQGRIEYGRAMRGAYALMRDTINIPADRLEVIKQDVLAYVPDLSPTTLEAFIRLGKDARHQDLIVDCESVADAVVLRGEEEIRLFIERWRGHFIETMNPQYLSENWSVDWHK